MKNILIFATIASIALVVAFYLVVDDGNKGLHVTDESTD